MAGGWGSACERVGHRSVLPMGQNQVKMPCRGFSPRPIRPMTSAGWMMVRLEVCRPLTTGASPTPHPLSSYSPRNKTPWRALSERLRGIRYCGSHSPFGGGAVLAGGIIPKSVSGSCRPTLACRAYRTAFQPGLLCLPATPDTFRTGYLPRQPTFHTGHAERESGRFVGVYATC